MVLKSHSQAGLFESEDKPKVKLKEVSNDNHKSDEPYESFLVYLFKFFKIDIISGFILKFFAIKPKSNFKDRFKHESLETPAAVLEHEHNEDIYSKQESLIHARTTRARGEFIDDELVSLEIVKHVVTADLADEYKSAQIAKKKLEESIGSNLFEDAFNANAMNMVLNETKESVGDIVDSMLRNPDAMRLVDDIKAFDNLSYKHAVDVCILMIAFGRELYLPKEALVELGIGGLLHDIGEVKPVDVARPRIRNIAMFQIYKSHVVDGIAMVKNSDYSDIVKSIIAEHHEKYNGTGYPYGLCNDDAINQVKDLAHKKESRISMYGLMIAVVDTYVSMVSGRNCVHAIAPSVAMSYIMKRAGVDFDSAICDAFSQVIGVYPVGVYVELNTGEIAVVIRQNRVWRLKPVIQVIMNGNHEKIEPFEVDLIHQSGGRVIHKEVIFETSVA
jgi:putative nucleotidyltransferase with HDIG domain